MVLRDKLLLRVRNNPPDVRFSDLSTLVEATGFVFKHQTARVSLNLQPDKNGKAKPYQVRDFLEAVDNHGLGVGEGPP